MFCHDRKREMIRQEERWQHKREIHTKVQKQWNEEPDLEEKIEEMLQEEHINSLISNCRTLDLQYPILNHRITGKNSLILIERTINQTGPILNRRTDIKIDPKSNIMS